MKNKFILPLFLFFSFLFSSISSQTLHPGVERWQVKTSLAEHPKKQTVSLNKLLSLPNPINSSRETPENGRIDKKEEGLKEGDLVTVTGYIHLIALENDSKKHRDGDYHIQIRTSSKWGDTCLIVEIPLPDFIVDTVLKKKCTIARNFILTKILNSKQPSTKGRIMTDEEYVTITGQLFFDASHLKGKPRGKQGMHSYTCWEIHPVTNIKFAKH